MSTPSLLDSLDTTVTLEWEATRTIGTLVHLGGRIVVLTALRAPPVGTTVYLRIERETSADAIAIDGSCAAVSDSEWGEHQVDVRLQRVGTTTSAIALREFIEAYGIERGGTVSVGRNRDNSDLKRFVYALPDDPEAGPVAPQLGSGELAAVPTANPSRVVAPAAVASLAFVPPMALDGRPTVPEVQVFSPMATQPAGVPVSTGQPLPVSTTQSIGVSASTAQAAQPLAPSPWTMPNLLPTTGAGRTSEPQRASLAQASDLELGTPVGDLDAYGSDDLLSALEDAAGSTVRGAAHKPPVVETTLRFGGGSGGRVAPPADNTESTRSFEFSLPHDPDRDDNEEILVNIVAPGLQQASPVAPSKERGLVGRLFGGKKGEPEPAAGEAAQQRTSEPVAAATLFAGESAQRVELSVQFEVGPKKRKVDGTLLRLSESKLRVRAQTLPAHYDRITVWVPGRGGPKDVLAIRCEVSRVHNGDGDPNQATFDARLSAGGNPPATMAKLREVMQAATGAEA